MEKITELQNTKQNQLKSLQGVRALAFAGIFSSHCGCSDLGAWGVSVFFILSGFLMVYNYYDREFSCSVRNNIAFSVRKIQKLYPLHILMMLSALVFVVYSLIKDFSFRHLILYIGEIILNIALMQTWVPSSAVYFSLNGVAWFLSVTLFLYAVFPVLLPVIKKISGKKQALTGMIMIYCIQVVIGWLSQSVNSPIAYFDSFPKWVTYIFPVFRMGDFLIGGLAGYIFIHTENKKRGKTGVETGIEIAVVLFMALSQYLFHRQDLFTGAEWFQNNMLYTPSSVLFLYVFARSRGWLSGVFSNKPMNYIGNISAYTFLIHQMVIRYLDVGYARLTRGGYCNPWVKLVIAFILTVFCAEVYIRAEHIVKGWQIRKIKNE